MNELLKYTSFECIDNFPNKEEQKYIVTEIIRGCAKKLGEENYRLPNKINEDICKLPPELHNRLMRAIDQGLQLQAPITSEAQAKLILHAWFTRDDNEGGV